jgi:hypothetical protein
MPAIEDSATETSPLLPKSNGLNNVPARPIEPSGGIAPGVPGPDDVRTRSEQEEDLEGQDGEGSDNGQPVPVEGMPEVKKQMKYLFPALGIGVRASYTRCSLHAEELNRYFSQLLTRQ